MRIEELSTGGVKPAIAVVRRNINNKTLSFNIMHGSFGTGLGFWSARLNGRFGRPTSESDMITLDKNTYDLYAVRNGSNQVMKDVLDNTLYGVTDNRVQGDSRGVIILWRIPNVNYSEVSYSLVGMCSELGSGWNGKDRGDVIYKSPAPVVEVFGDCILSWEAKTSSGETVKHVSTYDSNKETWDIRYVND